MPPRNQTLKKVGLLKDERPRRKPSPSTGDRPAAGQSERVSGAQKEAQPTSAQLSGAAYYAKRALGGLCLMGVLAILWAPKPKLITYNVAGRSVQSVYWEFAQGEGGRLLDVNYRAYLNEERRELSLCSPYDETQSKLACAKYAFQSESGTLPALYYLLTHPTL